jgi:hypothetical protein
VIVAVEKDSVVFGCGRGAGDWKELSNDGGAFSVSNEQGVPSVVTA